LNCYGELGDQLLVDSSQDLSTLGEMMSRVRLKKAAVGKASATVDAAEAFSIVEKLT